MNYESWDYSPAAVSHVLINLLKTHVSKRKYCTLTVDFFVSQRRVNVFIIFGNENGIIPEVAKNLAELFTIRRQK